MDTMVTLQEGVDFLAPDGLQSPSVSFVFLPLTMELTTATPSAPLITLLIHAEVRLTAGGTSTGFIALPDVQVQVPGIAIPTLLALFLHTQFKGATLLFVPADSTLGTVADVVAVLNQVRSAVSLLSSVARFAAFVLGLDTLSNVLSSEPHVQFRKADEIDNMNNITMIQRSWIENDTEAEDEMSSLIFIGAERSQVECFNDRDQDTGEGWFRLTVSNKLIALVRNLHSKRPVSEPDGTEIDIRKEPPGGWFNPDSFGDNLSSLRYP